MVFGLGKNKLISGVAGFLMFASIGSAAVQAKEKGNELPQVQQIASCYVNQTGLHRLPDYRDGEGIKNYMKRKGIESHFLSDKKIAFIVKIFSMIEFVQSEEGPEEAKKLGDSALRFLTNFLTLQLTPPIVEFMVKQEESPRKLTDKEIEEYAEKIGKETKKKWGDIISWHNSLLDCLPDNERKKFE